MLLVIQIYIRARHKIIVVRATKLLLPLTLMLLIFLVFAVFGLFVTQSTKTPSITIHIPKNAHDPRLNSTLIVLNNAGSPIIDGKFFLSLKQRPAIQIVNNEEPYFYVAIRITRAIYFPNGTRWGEPIFESSNIEPGKPLTYEFEKPGDYVVFTVPWPWLGGVDIRVVP